MMMEQRADSPLLGMAHGSEYAPLEGEQVAGRTVMCGLVKNSRAALPFLVSLAAFFITLALEGRIAHILKPPAAISGPVPHEARLAAARCLAAFVLVVMLWATHALPLHVTALLVAPLCVALRVYVDGHGKLMGTADAADHILHSMGNDAVFMVLGVYALGAALQKTAFERMVSRVLLSIAHDSLRLLAVVMLLAVGVSTFVTNVFAPVILLSVLTPLFHQLGPHEAPLVHSLVLGVSISSNIGGMPSPVSSPQNIVARSLMRDVGSVSFKAWLAATVPQCAAMLVIAYVLIVLRFRTHRYRFGAAVFAQPIKIEAGTVDFIVLVTFALTVFLWISPFGHRVFGHAGIISMIPLVVLSGTHVLTLADFKQLPWNVIYLVAGGTALGDAINQSHLLNLLAFHLEQALKGSSVLLAFCGVVLFMAVVAEGISHTVSAIIVLPLVQKIGLAVGHPRLLVMGGVLACSGAMSLPVSSFPNMSAFGVTNSDGESYLHPRDMLISGLPMTFACAAVICTVGYFIMAVVLGM